MLRKLIYRLFRRKPVYDWHPYGVEIVDGKVVWFGRGVTNDKEADL